ncbi:hypothetical protein [Thermomonas sp.]|uniref:hypothetical protein n=1 Tax=Thermomonas sp. TaxID=1971895 RepID=UPI0035AFD24D
MHRTPRNLALAAALATLALSGTATADTLLIQRVRHEPVNMPAHGASMAQVEAKFGAPSQKLEPRGGQKKAWPSIQRWVYPAFTVYFAHGHVVDAVANQAGPDEIGPKPAKP